jgi:hypothetical protein
MIAENEFEISKVISLLSDEDKIRRISKLYSIDEILEVLGYYDYSMDADDIKLIDESIGDNQDRQIYSLAIINGNFQQAIAMNKYLPV